MDNDGAIVVDFGSSSTKSGWSSEDTPRSVYPSVTTSNSNGSNSSNGSNGSNDSLSAQITKDLRKQTSIEHKCTTFTPKTTNPNNQTQTQQQQPTLNLSHPVSRGRIDNYDELERLIDSTLSHELELPSYSVNLPVLYVEPPDMTSNERSKVAQLLFESFKVTGVCFASSSILSLFASGRTRGVVLEAGAGKCFATPIFEGFSLKHSVLRGDFGGQDVTEYLFDGLPVTSDGRKAGYLDVRDVKHGLSSARIASDSNNKETVYELPDGTTIKVSSDHIHNSADILFNPSKYNITNTDGGIGDMLYKSIMACDKDVQADLWSNVVLSGGSTLIDGFSERVKSELEALHSNNSKGAQLNNSNLNVIPSPHTPEPGYNSGTQRAIAPWIGGSIFASLETFRKVLVSRQEYEDSGDGGGGVVGRKAVV